MNSAALKAACEQSVAAHAAAKQAAPKPVCDCAAVSVRLGYAPGQFPRLQHKAKSLRHCYGCAVRGKREQAKVMLRIPRAFNPMMVGRATAATHSYASFRVAPGVKACVRQKFEDATGVFLVVEVQAAKLLRYLTKIEGIEVHG